MNNSEEEYQLFSSLRYDPQLGSAVDRGALEPEGQLPTSKNFYMLGFHRDRMLSAAKHFQWEAAVAAISGVEGLLRLERALANALEGYHDDSGSKAEHGSEKGVIGALRVCWPCLAPLFELSINANQSSTTAGPDSPLLFGSHNRGTLTNASSTVLKPLSYNTGRPRFTRRPLSLPALVPHWGSADPRPLDDSHPFTKTLESQTRPNIHGTVSIHSVQDHIKGHVHVSASASRYRVSD